MTHTHARNNRRQRKHHPRHPESRNPAPRQIKNILPKSELTDSQLNKTVATGCSQKIVDPQTQIPEEEKCREIRLQSPAAARHYKAVSVRSAGPLEMTMLQVMHGGVYHRCRCLRDVDFVLCRKFDSFTLLLLAFAFAVTPKKRGRISTESPRLNLAS